MSPLTPEEIARLSSEELSLKLMEAIQHTKEQAAQTAEIVAEFQKTLVQIDDCIQTTRRILAQARHSEISIEIKHKLDELLTTRRRVKTGLDSARTTLKQARQNLRDTRDTASIRQWLKRLEEEDRKK